MSLSVSCYGSTPLQLQSWVDSFKRSERLSVSCDGSTPCNSGETQALCGPARLSVSCDGSTPLQLIQAALSLACVDAFSILRRIDPPVTPMKKFLAIMAGAFSILRRIDPPATYGRFQEIGRVETFSILRRIDPPATCPLNIPPSLPVIFQYPATDRPPCNPWESV